ncbi:peptide-methionine (S)-S-oxide reductase [Halobacteriovorax marinus]|uniref:peptide-methionine (S)-S-oxide reductase MsrA n=1 Tax=Halobacteriovorax marinus TaxID=97084 RepID=UPI000BC33318|nr:peptide-methionine (S)-S-oxide reductase MsrA [Halobacteriovorax marinus]ATH06798.1 peptide-methionine (S)-S-oxide reductase [Halobacteriovorax marinus]
MSELSTDYIILAGGCFWGMEQLFRELEGVESTDVGYTGGKLVNPTYKDVKTGETNHAEAIKITFETSKISIDEILHFFFKIHDPTTVNRQGNDIGSQYRSAIFIRSDEQREAALKVIKEVEGLGRFNGDVVTSLEDEREFYLAEDFHQDYLLKNPMGYTCHFIRK